MSVTDVIPYARCNTWDGLLIPAIQNGESYHSRSVNACQVQRNFNGEGVCIDYKIRNRFYRTLLAFREGNTLSWCLMLGFDDQWALDGAPGVALMKLKFAGIGDDAGLASCIPNQGRSRGLHRSHRALYSVSGIACRWHRYFWRWWTNSSAR